MRKLTIGVGVVVAGLMSANQADAAHHRTVVHHTRSVSHGSCAPARLEGEAFDVTGLKSELMVTALSCNEQDRYNAFIAKFHPELITEEAALTRFFDHTYGRGAQKAHDDYITQLANVQAERGLNAGVQFCQQRASMFDEVQVLDNASDLSGYARGKDIIQPADFESCAAPSAGGLAAHVRRVHARSHVHH